MVNCDRDFIKSKILLSEEWTQIKRGRIVDIFLWSQKINEDTQYEILLERNPKDGHSRVFEKETKTLLLEACIRNENDLKDIQNILKVSFERLS